MTLRDAILWGLGAGSGVLAWYALHRLETSITMDWLVRTLRAWFLSLASDDRRWTAFALTAVFAWAFYALSLVMQFQAIPRDWREWVQEMFLVASTAIIAGQIAHGKRELGV